MALVNGAEEPRVDGLSLAEALRVLGFDESRVACEVDGQIVLREGFSQRRVHSEDVIEVVQFVGGG